MMRMLSKLVLLLTVCLGLSAASIAAVRPHLTLNVEEYQPPKMLKISKLSGKDLINGACKGPGNNETQCLSALQAAPADQRDDALLLVLYSLKYVEEHAETVVAGIKKLSAVPNNPPMLQSALTDCHEQYLSIDDLIESAISSIFEINTDEAVNLINAAVASINVCDTQLQASEDDEKAENLVGKGMDMEKDLKAYNDLHKVLLLAALNIFKID